jgi:hypothetical protein
MDIQHCLRVLHKIFAVMPPQTSDGPNIAVMMLTCSMHALRTETVNCQHCFSLLPQLIIHTGIAGDAV